MRPTRGYPAGILQVSLVLDSGPAAKLAPGQTNVYTLVLSVDPSIPSGTVLAFPETVSTTSNDINLANNTATTSTPVTTSADTNLVVTGPAEVNAGAATFSFMTFNAGPSAEPSPFYEPPMGFNDGVRQTSFTLASGSGSNLAPGQSDVYTLVLAIPPNIANGTVISFTEQETPAAPDPNPANNITTLQTTFTTQTILPVNMTLTSSSPAAAQQGTAITLSTTIAPVTAGAVPTGTVTFTDNGAALGTANVQSDGTAALPATSALAVGGHTIIASYSGDSTYVATTQSLTQVITAVTPSPLVPIIGNVTLPSAIVAGAKIRGNVPVGLTDNGHDEVGNITVALFADTGTTLDGNQIPITSQQKTLAIQSGHHAVFIFKLTSLPANLPDGTYHIIAEVTDPSALTNEVATTQTITVAAPFVALAATVGPVLPASIAVGKPGSITVNVTNNGNINATGPLSITVAPSVSGTPIPGAVLATLSKSTTIKPGKTSKFAIHLALGNHAGRNVFAVRHSYARRRFDDGDRGCVVYAGINCCVPHSQTASCWFNLKNIV